MSGGKIAIPRQPTPLAAVVIGGLISSALLTLFMPPTLYNVFEREPKKDDAVHLPEPPATTELT